MLKILSYFNIALSIAYFLLYLLNSTSYATLGILAVIAFNAIVLHVVDKGIRFNTLHISIAATNFGFSGFLVLWITHVILSSIKYNYFGNTWLYISISIPFVLGIIIQVILSFIRYIKDKKDKLREN